MKQKLLLACLLSVLLGSSVAEGRELSAACAAEKQAFEEQAKKAYQRWDTARYDELKNGIRQIERFCTDEKLLQKVENRHSKQQKKVFEIQQSLSEAVEHKRNQQWLDEKTTQLRDAKDTLQSIEAEKKKLQALMGIAPSEEAQGASVLLQEPLAVDTPAYSYPVKGK